MTKTVSMICGGLVLLQALAASRLAIAEEPKIGWSDTAELSFVLTAGNAESKSLGFKNKLLGNWEHSAFELDLAAVRVESTVRQIDPATGDLDRMKRTTASNKQILGRYDRKLSDRFFWFVGAGWDRNRFAGVDKRYTGFSGVGNIWVARDDLKFRTDYAVSWTKQDDFPANPAVDDKFVGARLSWSYLNKLGASATYTNDLIVNENLDDTSDLRADMTNALAVAINKRLALKVSLQELYDHEPAALAISPSGKVLREAESLDTIFTTSLVVNF